MNEMSRGVTVLLFCGFLASHPALAENGDQAREAAIEKAREESIRRQELVIRAEKMVRDAEQMEKEKKYADAALAYEQVLKYLPKSPATEKLHASAVDGAVENRLRLANDALRAKDNAAARENANKVLDVDPGNKNAQAIVTRIERVTAAGEAAPPPEAIADPSRSPEVLTRDENISRLLREARLCYESGLLDQAQERLMTAYALNQYNEEVMRLLRRVQAEKDRLAKKKREIVVDARMDEVTTKWIPPVRRDITLPIKQEADSSVTLQAKVATEQKLNRIVLPQVKFSNARIESVVEFLVEESRRLDSEKRGVNIVLRLGESAPQPEAAPSAALTAPPIDTGLPPIPGAEPIAPAIPSAAPAAAPTPSPSSSYPLINVDLREIPLYDVLKLVTDLAQLKFRIERNTVVIVPLSEPAQGIISRVYPIQPGVFKTLVEIPESGGGEEISRLGAGVKKVEREDVKKFFEDAGVPMPPGASIVYNDRLSFLIASNTPENLEILERVIAQLNIIPSQVEIEAKFVEISQQDVNELGFKWNIGAITWGGDKNQKIRAEGGGQTYPFTPSGSSESDNITRGLRDASTVVSASALDALLGSANVLLPGATELFAIGGVLTDPQFQVVIRALAVQRNADLLSAPKVTTVSGNTAQIKIVREFRYPTEFTPPTATAAGGGTTGSGSVAVTPATPGGFETREVGVLLNVTPTVSSDGYTISLTLVPEVSDFEGFIDYGSEGSIAAGNTVVPVNFTFNQPVFSSRQVTTTIQIWDGQTVVLGGLIREDVIKIDDKVPLLGDIPLVGRLFRSKAESNVKRNLLIFVTARLIDPAGNPINKGDLTAPTKVVPPGS